MKNVVSRLTIISLSIALLLCNAQLDAQAKSHKHKTHKHHGQHKKHKHNKHHKHR